MHTFVRSYPFKISIILRSSLFFLRSYLRSYRQLNNKKRNKTRSLASRKKAKNFLTFLTSFLRTVSYVTCYE